MMMYKCNKEEGRKVTKKCRRQEACIDRTAFPRFDGSQENWAGGVFQELMKASGKCGVMKLAQRMSKLPEEDKKLITGVTSQLEA